MNTQTVSIIGLNRLGGSVGLALKQSSLDAQIVGHDKDHKLARQAAKAGAIDRAERNLANVAANADILVLAVPVSQLKATFKAIGEHVRRHAVVLDLTGWKSGGLRWAQSHLQNGHYIGAHVAYGAANLTDGRTNLNAATADLFQDSVMCLMPTAAVDPKAVDTAVSLGQILGASPYFFDAQEFDSLVQGIETIPGLAAAALFSTVKRSDGWRDMLRFAGLPFAQATLPIGPGEDLAHAAMGSREATLLWLDRFLKELNKVRDWIANGDEEVLAAVLTELSIERDRWLDRRAQNEWSEVRSPKVETPSFAEQMLGSMVRDRGRDRER